MGKPRRRYQRRHGLKVDDMGHTIPHTDELREEIRGAGANAKGFIDHVVRAICLALDHQANDRAGAVEVVTTQAQGDDGLMTLQEAAKFLNVTDQTVHAWRKRGIIEGLQFGEEWRFQRDELIKAGRKTRASKKPLRMVS